MDNKKGLERLLQGVLLLLGVLILLNGLVLWHVFQVERSVAPLRAVGQGPPDEGIRPGQKAPTFSLSDMQGNEISLSQFRGKRVLLVFASTECGVCKRMFPHLSEYHKRHPEQQIVMILSGSKEAKEEVVDTYHFDFPVLAWDNKVAHAYRVPGTPWFFVVDAEGIVRRGGTANSLESIEALVNEK